MDKWGKDKDHNIAFVAGLSGSGKSTVAKSIADDKTDTIHLDTYYDKSLNEKQNRRFNAF